jgi:hypothetical protein
MRPNPTRQGCVGPTGQPPPTHGVAAEHGGDHRLDAGKNPIAVLEKHSDYI